MGRFTPRRWLQHQRRVRGAQEQPASGADEGDPAADGEEGDQTVDPATGLGAWTVVGPRRCRREVGAWRERARPARAVDRKQEEEEEEERWRTQDM